MKIIEWEVPKSFELILAGDNQEGNILQYKTGYYQMLDYVTEGKNRFLIHMGDEMEAYWISDKRYDPVILRKTPLEQQEEVIKDLQPLALQGKLITILYGNHSHRLSPHVGDVTESTCKKLGVEYGTYSCVVNFKDDEGTQFKGYFTHGKKLIRTIADDPIRRLSNERLQLKQHLKNKFGDCLLMAKGHCHKLIVAPPHETLYLLTDTEIRERYTHSAYRDYKYIHPDHRWYVASGSFLRTFGEGVSSYSEMGEYDPVELGYAVVEVNDRQITNVRKVVV